MQPLTLQYYVWQKVLLHFHASTGTASGSTVLVFVLKAADTSFSMIHFILHPSSILLSLFSTFYSANSTRSVYSLLFKPQHVSFATFSEIYFSVLPHSTTIWLGLIFSVPKRHQPIHSFMLPYVLLSSCVNIFIPFENHRHSSFSCPLLKQNLHSVSRHSLR